MTYPISQPADNAAAYTWTQPIRDSIAGVNDHQTRLLAIEQLPNAKGDVITATADNVLARLPVGANGQVLTAASGQATGLQWATNAPGSGVTLDTAQTITGRKSFADVIITQGYYGTSNPQDRLVFNNSPVIDGSLLTAANPGDIVGMQNSVNFTGGFSAEYGYAGVGNPGWLWGANDFITTGTGSGDLAGITNMTARLCEVHVDAPGATIDMVRSIQADVGLGSTATGTTVDWLISIFGKGPNRSAGTVNTAATLYLTSPEASTATDEYVIYAAGPSKSFIGGDILMGADPGDPHTLNAYEGTVRARTFLMGPTVASDAAFTAAAVVNAKSYANGDIVSRFAGRSGQTSDVMQWATDTTINTRVDKGGRLAMRVNSVPADADVATGEVMFYVDTTTNPPTVKFKAKNNSGTVATRTITAT